MIVMKFGGTSVEDAAAIRNTAAIVERSVDRKPIVVASACAGVTNSLLALAQEAVTVSGTTALSEVEALRRRHQIIAEGLFSGELLSAVRLQIDAMMDSLRDLTTSIAILGELTRRSIDTFLSYGERLSSYLLFNEISHRGIPALLVDIREVLITDDSFTRAAPLFDIVDRKAVEILRPKVHTGQVVVTQGFLGATAAGVTTTLGRGGSDYTAAIIGAALQADEIQVWTDVDGVLTCDPRTVPDARLLERISFREAAELAYFGARVLHPSTILPAIRKDIPVRVVNSRVPEGPGTLILGETDTGTTGPVKAIAFKSGIILIHIESTRMLMMHGFLSRVFEIFAKYQKSVDVIATSEVSLSLTVDSEESLSDLFSELSTVADIRSFRNKAIFCVVGEKLRTNRGVLPRIFSTLEREQIHVGMVSLGASEINVTFVVDESEAARTARVLHTEFFP